MRFADIPGHEAVKTRLKAMADSGRIPHALLFYGPMGTGKMMMARAFAQYIHCTNRTGEGDSCGRCPSCLQHQAFNHIDTHYVFPVLKKKSKPTVSADYLEQWREFLRESPYMDFERWLSYLENDNGQPVMYVEESADLIHKLNYTAHNSKYKIVLLWLPERMNVECANKLLKLVEEPYEDTIFIMVSNNVKEILPTIYSRTQRVEFLRLPDAEIASILSSDFGVNGQDSMAIAHMAEGNMLAARNMITVSKTSELFLDLFMELMRMAYLRKVGELRQWGAKVADLGREQECRFLEYCVRLVRENFIYNLRTPELTYLNRKEAEFSAKFASFINERNVLKLTSVLDDAHRDIEANGNAKIVLFDLAIKVILLLKA